MPRALLPVDGSGHSLEAVRHAIRLARERDPLELHLLNVQPPLHGDVTVFVDPATVRDYHEERAAEALAAACALLDEAGVRYEKHVVVGHAARAIAAQARKLGCDLVIMGSRGLGAVGQLVLGSVTHETVHLLEPGIPVTLVKDAAQGERSSA